MLSRAVGSLGPVAPIQNVAGSGPLNLAMALAPSPGFKASHSEGGPVGRRRIGELGVNHLPALEPRRRCQRRHRGGEGRAEPKINK